jgi:hypothetical protein
MFSIFRLCVNKYLCLLLLFTGNLGGTTVLAGRIQCGVQIDWAGAGVLYFVSTSNSIPAYDHLISLEAVFPNEEVFSVRADIIYHIHISLCI